MELYEYDEDRWAEHPIWTQYTWDVLVMPDCGLDIEHLTVCFMTLSQAQRRFVVEMAYNAQEGERDYVPSV